ncbi:2-oxoglutarate dehydrogenase E1 component [Oleomonas cavernae]|uniref:2-oxoglutarate dehydrogenase E1 component n=1 Tax=Oleomonas cavernae TaxID=2320859 RepID=A0A418WJS7_9PROT|nr:2-oxoglutarate dehydrogenase E1 component [Oleomonas cavernae]RJF90069.1 2-oxoglutarate dehydrogenase E1 component [Oleomonas cavernae]
MTTQLDHNSFLNGANGAFIEDLFTRFQKDPASVDPSWASYFSTLGEALNGHTSPSWKRADWPLTPKGLDDDEKPAAAKAPPKGDGKAPPAAAPAAGASPADVRTATLDSVRALMMIRAYRIRGHLIANLDPLGLEPPKRHPELDPASYGFGEADMDRPIFIDNVLGMETATVREILVVLRRTYCSTIGVEFMHISDPDEKRWIQERIEGREKEISFTVEGKKAILNKLIEAEGFEHFLNKKFTGTKRFGLDGGEAVIPAMEGIIKRAGHLGCDEILLGMAHRGRLNVLANVMSKPYVAIFSEFQGGSANPDDVQGSGDVKYHLGTSSDREFDGNKVHLSLAANPSHLEIVDPVVLGKARAKQWQKSDTERTKVMPILLHGDAAFAGQGVVAECFGLSGLRGYRTGGTIHIIVNNQIGFTTSPHFSRSSPYPSDMAKMVAAPIFHVNGDDPEAVCHVAKVATEYRQQFHKDVVIDLFCYRRFGHNETDEPMFTQPLMYSRIAAHPSVRELYARRLAEEGLVPAEEAEGMNNSFYAKLEADLEASKGYKPNKADWFEGRWAGLGVARGDVRRGETDESMRTLKEIGKVLTTVPAEFTPHRTLRRVLDAKKKMFETGEGFDWATAEALAFGSLLLEGIHVRLSGQDSGRGTFSQRHSVWIDQASEGRYLPLQNLGEEASAFEVHDSMLSEAAVLGFEYGYSMAEPNALVLWEAQFGDFANGAQVVFDQFITSGESKWLRMSGLVCLLPHGYEGQGPEHSSARLERYLQLCAEDNIQVANCTTPANYFHILRRQIHRKFRKPLILMTPKSLLRHPKAVSSLAEMGPDTSFHRVLDDDFDEKGEFPKIVGDFRLVADAKIERVVMCSGKVYYDLLAEREKRGLSNIYIARVEQLYPFPAKTLVNLMQRFPKADLVWCQEEPRNMGAWFFVEQWLEWVIGKARSKPGRATYAGRAGSASPATGSLRKHVEEQAKLVGTALTL